MHTDPPEPAGVALQIGVVAARTELSIRTLRHYDQVGLVTPSARSGGGFRLYTERDIARLHTIRRMKPLGFTLDEMRQLLESLAVLADASVEAENQERASAFVNECQTRAAESCRALEKQLAYAVECRDLLADHRSPDGASPATRL